MLIKDLIDIPEHIYAGDFVIKLTEGITQPEETLQHYVLTEQLKRQYDRALSLIDRSLSQHKSHAAFLHGSFGSGKSHFMAVLNLLLQGNPTAWSHPDLSRVTVNYTGLRSKKLLLLAFHMIGAASMESAVLGGYAEQVARLHPESPQPAVYRGEQLFHDARKHMETMGEEAFFSRLASPAVAAKTSLGRRSGGSSTWDRERFEQATRQPAGSPERSALVSALLSTYFTSYAAVQKGQTENFLPFDEGLQVISRHARELGYDGIVLFLDELVLWLANKVSNQQFVHDEIQKLVKLVEAEHSDRPAPIISLVARQRDLKDLIGETLSGFEQFNFHDQIKHFEKRFDQINLEDSNLPEIISRRILKPRSADASQRLQEQFERLNLKGDIRDILVGNYEPEAFRKVYPFSPALIDTLVAVSSLLQRNRTAIRILMELLVGGREQLQMGQLIPVGDLFDLVSSNYEPYSDSVRKGFESAKRLLNERFLPLLQDAEGKPLPTQATDLRLIKTILLAALLPEVAALRKLTPQKLAALNHGTLKAPIPGQEAAQVRTRLKNWQANIGELRLDPDTDEISLNLTSVDLDKILENAKPQDTTGNRKRFLRELLFSMMKISPDAQTGSGTQYELTWRGTRRLFEVSYLNIREMTNLGELKSNNLPRLIIDYPFDEEGHPSDDLVRLQAYRDQQEPTRTTVWLPYFLSRRTLNELGRLIQIEYVMTGDRLQQHLAHLAPTDRPSGQALLTNQRNALQERMRSALEMAYGIRAREPGILDESDQKQLASDQQLQSLNTPVFRPRMPAAPTLEIALRELLSQELEAYYPAHPAFSVDGEIRVDLMRKVWQDIKNATRAENNRLEILDKGWRERLKSIVEPLQLGTMGDTHFLLKDTWVNRLEQEMAKHQITGVVKVERLYEWMDLPRPMGLPRRLQALVVFTFAEQTQRQVFRQGALLRDYDAELPPDAELRPMELPSSAIWQTAWERVKLLDSSLYPMQCSLPNVEALSGRLGELLPRNLREFPMHLRVVLEALEVPVAQSVRMEHARAAAQLLDLLNVPDARQRLEKLAEAPWSEPPAALVAHIQSAEALLKLVSDTRLLQDLKHLPKLTEPEAVELREELVETLTASELARPLAGILQLCYTQIPSILHRRVAEPVQPPLPTPEPTARRVKSLRKMDARASEIRADLEEVLKLLQDDSLRVTVTLEVWEPPQES